MRTGYMSIQATKGTSSAVFQMVMPSALSSLSSFLGFPVVTKPASGVAGWGVVFIVVDFAVRVVVAFLASRPSTIATINKPRKQRIESCLILLACRKLLINEITQMAANWDQLITEKWIFWMQKSKVEVWIESFSHWRVIAEKLNTRPTFNFWIN